MVEPIDTPFQEKVISTTSQFIARAESLYDRSFRPIPVNFDLKGRTAGMYRVRNGQAEIRYNPFLFAKFPEDNLATTVPHEVAHYITDQVFGLRNIRPHGKEWKSLMAEFGCDASRTCQYDLKGIPVRREARHLYQCSCTTHQLTRRRHNRILRHNVFYLCRICGDKLVATMDYISPANPFPAQKRYAASRR